MLSLLVALVLNTLHATSIDPDVLNSYVSAFTGAEDPAMAEKFVELGGSARVLQELGNHLDVPVDRDYGMSQYNQLFGSTKGDSYELSVSLDGDFALADSRQDIVGWEDLRTFESSASGTSWITFTDQSNGDVKRHVFKAEISTKDMSCEGMPTGSRQFLVKTDVKADIEYLSKKTIVEGTIQLAMMLVPFFQ